MVTRSMVSLQKLRNSLLLLFVLFPMLLSAGEFVAHVNRNQVTVGENFTLTLSLSDVKTHANPVTAMLNSSFIIHSQQQSSNMSVINGHVSSSLIWRLVLSAKQEGDLTIPSISVNTSEGLLSSQPIQIRVVKSDPSSKNQASKGSEVVLTAEVSETKPYKNEPVFFTIKLASKQPMVNVKVQKFEVENAIVELSGEPQVSQKIEGGMKINLIEFNYLITPLKPGALTIPPIAIQGGIPEKRRSRSAFDDDFGLSAFFTGFEHFKSFMQITEKVSLDVQPPIADVSPWLPAKSLVIEEIWDQSQTLQVGDPFTRKFKISAAGIPSSALPGLNDLQINGQNVKIYADKPEVEDEVKENVLYSSRKENYTLIPQQSGDLTLPEILVAWWDTSKKEKAVARIPSRTLQIQPRLEPAKNMKDSFDELKSNELLPEKKETQKDFLPYILISALAVLLAAAIFWVIALQKKIGRLSGTTPTETNIKVVDKPQNIKISVPSKKITKTKKDKNEKLPDLNPT